MSWSSRGNSIAGKPDQPTRGAAAGDESVQLRGKEKPLKGDLWTWQQGEINLQKLGWAETVEGVRNAADRWPSGVGPGGSLTGWTPRRGTQTPWKVPVDYATTGRYAAKGL